MPITKPTLSIVTGLIQRYTTHPFVALTNRGNTAIEAALSALPRETAVLIPEEGGWLAYKSIPEKLGLGIAEVKCHDARISLSGVQEKLEIISKTAGKGNTGEKNAGKPAALLYQNPGGYFAAQPMEEIYSLCRKTGCPVIMDVSGSIGTPLCDGRFADILVGSFGRWKLVDAGSGGFFSCRDETLFRGVSNWLVSRGGALGEASLPKVRQKLQELPRRIAALSSRCQKIKEEMQQYAIVHPGSPGFVVIVRFNSPEEKEKIINYCRQQGLPWTECPRYIRLNAKAISIEVKRL